MSPAAPPPGVPRRSVVNCRKPRHLTNIPARTNFGYGRTSDRLCGCHGNDPHHASQTAVRGTARTVFAEDRRIPHLQQFRTACSFVRGAPGRTLWTVRRGRYDSRECNAGLDVGAHRTRCATPAWTFVAAAHAATMAGLIPFFVDVDADTWAVDPEGIAASIAGAPAE